ncbi:MAG: hypothetical protein HRU09_02025 [Oligoflexales bacterium]|nr:hypothetical protein [Oligoflexales bacterium]
MGKFQPMLVLGFQGSIGYSKRLFNAGTDISYNSQESLTRDSLYMICAGNNPGEQTNYLDIA